MRYKPYTLAPPDQPRQGPVWQTLVPKTRLMPDPHCENGGQDFRVFSPSQVLYSQTFHFSSSPQFEALIKNSAQCKGSYSGNGELIPY